MFLPASEVLLTPTRSISESCSNTSLKTEGVLESDNDIDCYKLLLQLTFINKEKHREPMGFNAEWHTKTQ